MQCYLQIHVEKSHSIGWKNALFVINSKNEEVFQMIESALISKLPNFNLSSGFLAFPIMLHRILLWNFISNDSFLYIKYFNMQVAFLISSYFPFYIMLLELPLYLFFRITFFFSWLDEVCRSRRNGVPLINFFRVL